MVDEGFLQMVLFSCKDSVKSLLITIATLAAAIWQTTNRGDHSPIVTLWPKVQSTSQRATKIGSSEKEPDKSNTPKVQGIHSDADAATASSFPLSVKTPRL